MKLKLLVMSIVIASFLFAGIGAAQAENIFTNLENKLNANQQVNLGSATIFGNGVEEETIVNAEAIDDISIQISSKNEIVDFYISYDITCDGVLDDGRVYFLVQINGENQELREINTSTILSGNLKLENVDLRRGDIVSFEIGAVYTNVIPPFSIPDIDVGAGIVPQKINTISIFSRFPFIQILTYRFPILKEIF